MTLGSCYRTARSGTTQRARARSLRAPERPILVRAQGTASSQELRAGVARLRYSGRVDTEARLAAFDWLRQQQAIYGEVLAREMLTVGFTCKGSQVTLVGPTGIWKPRGFDLPLSITTVSDGPYDDSFTTEGLLRYRYRGSDPNHRDNAGLREAMRTRTPLIYFHGVMPGRYVPVYPVFVLDDHPQELACLVAIDPAYTLQGAEVPSLGAGDSDQSILGVQKYVAAYVKRRLHQTLFRERVVAAYSSTCAVCRLRHQELLDAAHIVPDARPEGTPVVPNGLCLCKIHHAAFDQNIIGVSPDYVISVREDVLREIDGPMLKHGLQGVHDQAIVLPHRQKDRPDRDRLAWRFDEFRKAG